MRIQLSDHFNYTRLIRFVIPSIIMMIFTSIYGVIDGLFVSNYVGKTAFAALNLIMPVLMIMGAMGFMLGTGGSAIVANILGMGDKKRANRYFSMFIYIACVGGVALAVIGNAFIRSIAAALGAEGEMLEFCVIYARILLVAIPAFMLQNMFQSFFVTAEKPKLGLYITVAAGISNMVLDYVFIVIFDLDLSGAALATAVSQVVGGIVPMFYFAGKNSSLLRLTRAKFEHGILLKACTNGSSELMTNISMSLVSILYNFRLMELAGENGISAYGVIMYISFGFNAIFIGYSIGTAPIIGYNYGAQNLKELKNLLLKSLKMIGVSGIVLSVTAVATAPAVSYIFVGYDKELFDLTNHAIKLYSLSYIFCGFNIFGSAFFTALNNGVISATISFLRTMLFQVIAILVLPVFFDENGIWLAVTAAEMFSLVITVYFVAANRKRYGYL